MRENKQTQTSRQARHYYVLDAGLMLGFALILATGLVISSWLALPLGNYAAWGNVHVATLIVTVLIVVIKLGLHLRWIVETAQQFFPVPAAPVIGARPMQLVTASAGMSRRSFLMLMGAVSVPAILAIGHVLDGGQAVLAQVTDQGQATLARSSQTATQPTSSANASSTVCTIRCNKGCAYPGHCQRYVDTNGNSRCDWGECM